MRRATTPAANIASVLDRIRAASSAGGASSPTISVERRVAAAPAHGHADVRRGETRRVVHSVSNHRDFAAFGLKFSGDVPLLLGGYLGFDASTWYGLVGPGKMPLLFVRRMNADVNKVLAMPDVKERLASVGAEDAGGTPIDFERFIASETKKWGRVVKDAKVKFEG